METYNQMKDRHQSEVNALPIRFAFSNEQFDEVCKELGVKDPPKELYKMPGGGFYRKEESKRILDTFRRHDTELAEAMKDESFAKSAFEYEAWDHELIYSYTPDEDMACVFGYPLKKDDDGYKVIDWDKVDGGDKLCRWYVEAIRKYRRKALENA